MQYKAVRIISTATTWFILLLFFFFFFLHFSLVLVKNFITIIILQR